MATPVNFQRLRWKIILIIIVLLSVVVGSCKRALAYTSDPNAIAFCVIAKVNGYKLYQWRCFTNQTLYEHVIEIQQKNKAAGYWTQSIKAPWYYAFLDAPEAHAAGCVSLYSELGNASNCGSQDAEDELTLIKQVYGENAVLVYDVENQTYEIKKLQDTVKNQPDVPVCNPADWCNGSGGVIPVDIGGGQHRLDWRCVGGCQNPVCSATQTLGTNPFTKDFTGTFSSVTSLPYGASTGLPSTSPLSFCEGYRNKTVQEKTADKVVDDPVTKEKVGNAAGADAAKGATPSSSGGSSNAGDKVKPGDKGLDSSGSDAGGNVDNRIGKKPGTGGGDGTQSGGATENTLKQIKDKMEGGSDNSHYTGSATRDAYRGGVPNDVAAGFRTGMQSAFNSFVNDMRSTALFSSATNFFNAVPGGSLGTVTINGGSHFGSTTVNFGDYATFFNILRGAVIVACTYVGIRIVTKGGA